MRKSLEQVQFINTDGGIEKFEYIKEIESIL